MAYTEIKEKNKRIYYYRVKSIRVGNKFQKKRIYLGVNLSKKSLKLKENNADKKLNSEKKKKELLKIIPIIKKVLDKYNIKRAGIFGSYSFNGQKKDSDIDILIEPPKKVGFGFLNIQFDLESKLKRKIDLVSYNGLSPYIKEKILKQEIKII